MMIIRRVDLSTINIITVVGKPTLREKMENALCNHMK